MALIPAAKMRNEVHKLMMKKMARRDKNGDPKAGKLYRMDPTNRELWTTEHGHLWVYTGRGEGANPLLHKAMPVFKSVATGHEEWLPWDWLEEVDDGAA